jgi:hypothetical protein
MGYCYAAPALGGLLRNLAGPIKPTGMIDTSIGVFKGLPSRSGLER